MEEWIRAEAARIAARFERDLAALVAVSSPSGDAVAFEECAAIAIALAPEETSVERPPCSSPEHAPDLVLRLQGTGRARLLLVGHLDTVHAHDTHRPLEQAEDRWIGSGSVDMKGGDVFALALLRALATRRADFAEVALLLVGDEEWRTAPFAHVDRFAGWDACLCFEAGQLAGGEEAVVVRRKAAGTIRVRATGRAAHSGSAPDRGANALLALTAAATAVAARHDPTGPERLTAVPTVIHSGDAFNVVPASGELLCDTRASSLEAIDTVASAVPTEVGGATLQTELLRRWPPMDSREATAGLLAQATDAGGRRIVAAGRGGASDASHFAPVIALTVDGLGPRGGAAHNPDEHVLVDSVEPRAAIALALVLTALGESERPD
ncbi:MAG: M20/M25/M40 family metallo-hydrolase [Solirubrobacterales bacterium]